ncbi:MAG: 30S ribosome-binding factor RbfA [Deltaproteobacteria bacterium]|nr:30S ribosome-binding factor RbfA [Deltaproteobacteria bacterium]
MHRAQGRRASRMADQVMQEIARILVEEIEDPRLAFVTVTGVRMNKDFSIAEVLFTHFQGEEKAAEIIEAFGGAQGFLRSRLGSCLRLRTVPELRFAWDTFLKEMIYGQEFERPDPHSER